MTTVSADVERTRRELDELDLFAPDDATVVDPHGYFAKVRSLPDLYQEPHHGVFIVTRLATLREVMRNTEDFSSINVVTGPLAAFSFDTARGDIRDEVAATQATLPPTLLMQDPPAHTRQRALVAKLFTPRRVAETEPVLRGLAHELIDRWSTDGRVDFVRGFAKPFPFLAVAELLGVPQDDLAALRTTSDEWVNAGQPGMGYDPFVLGPRFSEYIADRREYPRDDYLTRVATFEYEDGSLPDVGDVGLLATAIFSAGQETASHMFANGMQLLAKDAFLADRLRHEPHRVPAFVEEVLRLEAPGKGTFRLALVDTVIERTPVPAGSTILLAFVAANRDGSVFERSDEFDLEREDGGLQATFGFGPHYCVGASLARIEGTIGFGALLERLDAIHLDDALPAVPLPSFMLLGVTQLGIRFKPRGEAGTAERTGSQGGPCLA